MNGAKQVMTMKTMIRAFLALSAIGALTGCPAKRTSAASASTCSRRSTRSAPIGASGRVPSS